MDENTPEPGYHVTNIRKICETTAEVLRAVGDTLCVTATTARRIPRPASA